VLAGCEPPVPDSRPAGVGFESYSEYQRRHVAQAAAAQAVPGPVQNAAVPFPAPGYAAGPATAPAAGGTGTPTAAELAQAGIGSVPDTGPALAQTLPQTFPPADPALPSGVP